MNWSRFSTFFALALIVMYMIPNLKFTDIFMIAGILVWVIEKPNAIN